MGNSLHNLAEIYAKVDRCSEALDCGERALEIYEKLEDPNKDDLMRILTDLRQR